MQTIHYKIHKYIDDELNEDEIRRLWKYFLTQPVWYDYFITELTAQRKLRSSDSETIPVAEHLMSRLPDLPECFNG